MTKKIQMEADKVTLFIKNLPTEIQPAVQYLREVILSSHDMIGEHIKWNSPAFYYKGEMKTFDAKEYKRDILVMNLRKGKILCVLPVGQTIRQNTELLEGNYTDGRRMIHFSDINDIKSKEDKLVKTLQEWVDLAE